MIAALNAVVKDVDGDTYRTVKIGTQVWLAENMKTNRYGNGDPITRQKSHKNTIWTL